MSYYPNLIPYMNEWVINQKRCIQDPRRQRYWTTVRKATW